MSKATIRHELFFKSLQELIDYTLNTDSALPETTRSSRAKINESGWAGTDSFETAVHLAQFGWEEGLKKVKLITKDLVPKFYELFPRQDSGEELVHDVGGAYQDPVVSDMGIDPLDMINFRPKFDEIKQGNTLQRLIIETGVSSFITPETLFCRGACVLAMLESLETFGFRIEVILQSTINRRNGGDTEDAEIVVFRTCLKQFDEHSDYDKFAYCIANASFLRRLMFSCMECAPLDVVNDFGFYSDRGYSYPHNHPLYLDPERDFYMTRPLDNADLGKCIVDTVELINKRYKGFVQTVENPKLEGDGGSAK